MTTRASKGKPGQSKQAQSQESSADTPESAVKEANLHSSHQTEDLNPTPQGYRKGSHQRKNDPLIEDLLYSEGMINESYHLSLGAQNGD